nr:MAG TPA: hypothetical protein [Caudoviricetes sp.]
MHNSHILLKCILCHQGLNHYNLKILHYKN